MDSSLTAKITDFGLSKTKELLSINSATPIVGTILWAAPENLTDTRISERGEPGDVYSFGVIAWELIVVEAVLKGIRPTIPASCPKPLKELMTLCWRDGRLFIAYVVYIQIHRKDQNSTHW